MPRLPMLHQQGCARPHIFIVKSFRLNNTFFDSDRNPYARSKIQSDRFWSIPQREYYTCVLYGQKRIFPHKRLSLEAMKGLPCFDQAIDCLRDVGLLAFVTDHEDWNEELIL